MLKQQKAKMFGIGFGPRKQVEGSVKQTASEKMEQYGEKCYLMLERRKRAYVLWKHKK